MNTSHLLLSAFLALAGGTPEPRAVPPPPEPLRVGFQAIEESDLRAWVGFLASPELEGRETGRRGYDVAARFCASLYQRFGLAPCGDRDTYFQEFDVVRTEWDEESYLEVKDDAGTERFKLAGNVAPRDSRELDWAARWTLVGNGEGADADARDPYRGLPLSERVVLVVPRPGQKFETRGARAAGARRVAVVSDEWIKTLSSAGTDERPAFFPAPAPQGAEIVFLSTKLANRVLRKHGFTVDQLSRRDGPLQVDLAGVDVKLSIKRKTTVLRGRNVVGILQGSDPELKHQVVTIGAHLDHVGVQNGKLFPGADDDASGTAGVLAIMKAFAASPRKPARSICFLLFAGEEKGLWGSRYFVDHPPMPLDRIMAHLQMDMIGRNEERDKKERAEDNLNSVHLVGADRLSRDVQRSVLSANRFVGLDFEYDEESAYDRSDQYHFAERGIPISFFFTGFHPDYHQPTDTPDKINYAKMARILQLIYATAFDLADRREPLHRVRRL